MARRGATLRGSTAAASAAQPAARRPAPARARIYDSIVETIGATPLVRLHRLPAKYGVGAELLAKVEFFNPLGSVKDRIGLAMIEAAEAAGKIAPGRSTLIEPTSGNTGIGLAFVAAARGYRLILIMPDNMSVERRRMLRLLGARLELTPAAQGMAGAVARAEALLRSTAGAFMPQQFDNPANPEIHRRTTAEEIWTDCAGRIDGLVAGVGTGGTISGVGRLLKERQPQVRVIAVEPEDSAVLSGGSPGGHRIQGIGAGFVPKVLDRTVIDEIVRISNETSFRVAREAAALDGLPVGISAGAALAAAIEIGQRRDWQGKRLVVVIPDFAERYLSTPLFERLDR